jgi:hypothetical protein
MSSKREPASTRAPRMGAAFVIKSISFDLKDERLRVNEKLSTSPRQFIGSGPRAPLAGKPMPPLHDLGQHGIDLAT